MVEIKPHKGPQEAFLCSPADIAIYGGSAGGGKSWALLVEALRHTCNPDFGAVIFRRTSPQITNEGALWDEAGRLYQQIGGVARQGDLSYRMPSGASITFRHLQHEVTKFDWQGAQVPLICFDELCHFTASQFWYLLSRNRSMCGVRPYVRASCNPDADSWVAQFISWWIDQDSGYPIPERAGVLRWFIRLGENIEWADSEADLAGHAMIDENGKPVPIPAKSVTFIPAKLSDNPALMRADPGYMANLLALPAVERGRLLDGNWKIRPAAGLYFQRAWCSYAAAAPAGLKMVRGWDLAATPQTAGNDPDWTVGVLIGKSGDGRIFILDARWLRGTPDEVNKLILNTAQSDGRSVAISLPQDPAQAGKSQALYHTRMLAGFDVKTTPEARNPGGDARIASQQPAKVTRFAPLSAQAQGGNVTIVRPDPSPAGHWSDRLCDELEAFPEAKHDDSADAAARAFAALLGAPKMIIQRFIS